jgi:type 1 glutamine amidotransferase
MKQANKISRRDLLQNVAAVAAAGALGASEMLAAPQQASTTRSGGTGGKPRVLALIGDRYHNSDYIRVSLNRLFNELSLPVDYTTNYYDLSGSLLRPYQLFVCFRDNMIFPGGYLGPDAWSYEASLENRGDFPPAKPEDWITEEQGKAVQDFVSAGNGFYSMHNNGFVSRASKNFREVQGGVDATHLPLRPFKVRIVNKEHPVTKGVEDFMVNDEQHYLAYDKDPKNILLRGENIDGLTFGPPFEKPPFREVAGEGAGDENLGESISGWAHEYGQGRVVFTAIGHTIHAMWQPEYLKIQKNAVRWLLKMT